MKSTPEPKDTAPVLGAPIRSTKPASDRMEHVSGHIWRNTRTGQLETRQPELGPVWAAPIWTPVIDEQCED